MKIPTGADLINFTANYKKMNNIKNVDIAAKTGVSRTLISRYLRGKYESNPETAEKAIIKYFDSIDDDEGKYINPVFGEQTGQEAEDEYDEEPEECEAENKFSEKPEEQEEKPVIKNNTLASFYESRDAAAIVAVCSLCQEETGLGAVVGKSGYGKTYTLKQYAKRSRVCYVECSDCMTSRDLVDAVGLSVGIPTGSGGTVWSRIQAIKDFFEINEGYLLIIDEADKLLTKYSTKKMEIIRDIFGERRVGIVVAGEPALKSMLKLYLPRFASRIDCSAELNGLTDKEIRDYLKDFNADEEVVEAIVNRGTNANTGCFRLLDRTLRNIFRIKQDNSIITKKDLNIASNMMML